VNPALPSSSTGAPPARRPFWGRCQRGFTILEVSLATFVMALGISTSIIAIQQGFRALDLARGTTLASQIMQSEIERLRLESWASISALPASETVDLNTMFTSNAALIARFSSPNGSVTRTVSTDASRPDVRYITLTVTWKTYDGRSHTRSSTTMYSKNGLYDYYYTLAGGS
jgi:Tfp pilus assembly protein PilV